MNTRPTIGTYPLHSTLPSSRRYLLKVIVSGKGMTPDAKKETALWVRLCAVHYHHCLSPGGLP